MTTLPQSELDDIRQKAEAAADDIDTIRPGCVLALLDHIAQLTAQNKTLETALDMAVAYQNKSCEYADKKQVHITQLTAERDEQRDIVAKIWVQLGSPTYNELQGRSIYDLIDGLKVRIAELEAQPSAQANDDDVDRVAKALCESDGCCWDDVADTNAIVMSQSWEGSLTSKEDYRHDARAAIAAMPKPSAQFVAGMWRAAEMLDVPRAELLLHAGEMTAQESRTVYAVLKWRATAILAEAALKGEGE